MFTLCSGIFCLGGRACLERRTQWRTPARLSLPNVLPVVPGTATHICRGLPCPPPPLPFASGVYSQPDNIMWQRCQEALFTDPSVTYSVDSGGDPTRIPDLTFDDYMAFHRNYYHPSNARFFFYGDDPLEERLRLLNGYLKVGTAGGWVWCGVVC